MRAESSRGGPEYVDGRYRPERRRNLVVQTHLGGRILSASQLPWFTALPPSGYGVITTTGLGPESYGEGSSERYGTATGLTSSRFPAHGEGG